MSHRPVRDAVASYLHRLARRISTRVQAASPDPVLLDNLVEHIAHELAAMDAAAVLHQQTQLWIALEDFLLHARILSEFFWPGESARSHPDSAVLAEHYHRPWRQLSGGPPEVFRCTKDAIDTQLAHIGRERVTAPQDLAAEVPALQEAIWRAWKRFLGQLGTDPRAGRFKRSLAARCAALRLTPPAGTT